jgi:S1-C subfamily serine protease
MKSLSMFNFFFLTLPSFIFLLVISTGIQAHSIVSVVAKTKPSVVGIGLYDAMGVQTHQLRGSGFVFGDGSLIATNYHVVSVELDPNVVQYLIVFSGTGAKPLIHKAQLLAKDTEHDLAILKIDKHLPPVTLADNGFIAEGTEILLTGFPIGAVLGLYPATHRGIIAAMTPDVIPTIHSQQLSSRVLESLTKPYLIYQLDITAYPGNSGSPLYLASSGEVVGILNKVFVKETKESVLEKPSGISYAIPVKYLTQLAASNNIRL